MNCRRIEEMIPLYVEGDLDTDRADMVSAHLRSCNACSELAGGFDESQEWLHSYTPPAFDATFFDGLRNGVLSRIENERARPSFFQLIATRWRWNAALAAAVLLLVIWGLVFYVNQQSQGRSSNNDKLANRSPQSQEAPAPRKEPELPNDKPNGDRATPHRRTRPSLGKAVAKLVAPAKTELAIGLPKLENENSTDAGTESTAVSRADPGQDVTQPWTVDLPMTDSKTRIEIQTSDPTIRIIWFAPNNVDKNSSRRSSDS